LPAVTLTFDLLTPKSNQHIYEPNTSVTNIGWNSFHWLVKDVLYLPRFFASLPAVTLTFDLWTPKSNQHNYEPKYICKQNCVKFSSLVFDT